MIGPGVTIGRGAVIRDSIIMRDSTIGEGCMVYKSIVAENCELGENVSLGVGEFAPSKLDPKVYAFDLVTIGENSYNSQCEGGQEHCDFRRNRRGGLSRR